jgi:hypothetical protein
MSLFQGETNQNTKMESDDHKISEILIEKTHRQFIITRQTEM